jgi:hypothetical protein
MHMIIGVLIGALLFLTIAVAAPAASAPKRIWGCSTGEGTELHQPTPLDDVQTVMANVIQNHGCTPISFGSGVWDFVSERRVDGDLIGMFYTKLQPQNLDMFVWFRMADVCKISGCTAF